MRDWWEGSDAVTGTYREHAVEVEFAADVVITKERDGDWQSVHPETVEIETVKAAEQGDILGRMDAQELEELKERCAEFAQGRG